MKIFIQETYLLVNTVKYLQVTKSHWEKKMAKKVSMIRIREDRADKLREKAVELTIERKELIKESELVNYLIDEFVERIKIDQNGLYVEEEKE